VEKYGSAPFEDCRDNTELDNSVSEPSENMCSTLVDNLKKIAFRPGRLIALGCGMVFLWNLWFPGG